LELPVGSRYTDDWHRTHIISNHFDNFTSPFPLFTGSKFDLNEIRTKWKDYQFPDLTEDRWFPTLNKTVALNKEIDDPLSVWGVINGPLEPTWQLLSDGWPAFFILARKDRALAEEIIRAVCEECIKAGQAMIRRGVKAIRIGDDYAINEGLYVKPELWKELIYPYQKKLVAGLKAVGGQNFPVVLHSDGNITDILDLLGDSGLDGLNPIQPGALDFKTVVNTIGHKLSMTAAFDLQYFLQSNSPETLKAMKSKIHELFEIVISYNRQQKDSHRTNFCIAPSHQVQPGSDPALFDAWIRMVHEANAHFF
jgi:uroporphyrinogen-III decarboxylase